MSKRAAIYARVSTDEQAESGYGLAYQIEKCTQHATNLGYEVVSTVTDDYTGATAIRPGINQMLDLIQSHRLQTIIIHRTDRLGRKARVQDILEAEFEARGVRVEYATAQFEDSAQGRFMRRISGAVNELDYETIVDRLKEHKVQKVKSGSIIAARAPYGYRTVTRRNADGKRGTYLEIDEDEAQYVRLIFEWYVNGDESGELLATRAIVKRLQAMGVTKRSDVASRAVGSWSTSTVFDILHRESYTGRWYYNKTVTVKDPTTQRPRQVDRPRSEWVMVSVPAIITDDVFEMAQARAQRNLEQASRNRKHTYLFSGMMRCKTCGQRFGGMTFNPDYRHYRCGRRTHQKWGTGCPETDYGEHHLDRALWGWISDLVTHPEKVEDVLRERQEEAENEHQRLRGFLATTARVVEQKQTEQANIIRLYAKTPIPALEEQIAQFQREIDEHEREHGRIATQLETVTYSPLEITDIKERCTQIAVGLEHFTAEEKRRTYELLELNVQLTVEDGWQVAYAECIIDLNERRLPITAQKGPASNDQGKTCNNIVFGLSRSAAHRGR